MMKQSLLVFSLLFLASQAKAVIEPITTDVYQIKKGDSLSKIAIRKWGDMQKWHDLWKINGYIQNPDLIYPGQRVRLLSNGQIEFFDSRLEARNSKAATATKFRHRSSEWRLLPSQSWEKFVFQKDAAVDPLGFDRRSKVQKRFANQTPMTATIATDRIAVQGEIVHARTEFEHIFLGDQVFIRADEALQVGSTYSLTAGPEKVRSKRDGRIGFIYDLVGKVKIIGVRDSSFIGTIIETQGFISRHDLLIPEVKQVEFQKPIASSSIIQSTVLISENSRQTYRNEHSIVFLDVGANDGVKAGMIFRSYLHKDPFTSKDISNADYLIESEMIVLDVKEQFCSAILLTGRGSLTKDSAVMSLSDLTDFKKHMGMQTAIQDGSAPTLPDELDKLDTDQGLGEKEEGELRQLENVDNPDEIKRELVHPADHSSALGDEPAPNDQGVLTAPVSTESPAELTDPALAPETASPDQETAPIDPALDSSSPAELAPPDLVIPSDQNIPADLPPSTP